MKENIKEDIEILERIDIKFFISGMEEHSNYIIDKADEVNNAIDHILSNYKRVLKENEELKIDNDIMKQDLNGNILYVDELEENYISKNKIKEILEETEITDFNSLVETFLEIKKSLESE